MFKYGRKVVGAEGSFHQGLSGEVIARDGDRYTVRFDTPGIDGFPPKSFNAQVDSDEIEILLSDSAFLKGIDWTPQVLKALAAVGIELFYEVTFQTTFQYNRPMFAVPAYRTDIYDKQVLPVVAYGVKISTADLEQNILKFASFLATLNKEARIIAVLGGLVNVLDLGDGNSMIVSHLARDGITNQRPKLEW